MRDKNRIKPFLEELDVKEAINYLFDFLGEEAKEELSDIITNNKTEIMDFWLEMPDLRFTQVLVNMGIIGNRPGIWYYTEEDDIIENQNKKRNNENKNT